MKEILIKMQNCTIINQSASYYKNQSSAWDKWCSMLLLLIILGVQLNAAPSQAAEPDAESIICAIESREARLHDISLTATVLLAGLSHGEIPTEPVEKVTEKFASGMARRFVDKVYLSRYLSTNEWAAHHIAWSSDGDIIQGINYDQKSGTLSTFDGSDWADYWFPKFLGYQVIFPQINVRKPLSLSEVLRAAEHVSINNATPIEGYETIIIECRFKHELFPQRHEEANYMKRKINLKIWVVPRKDFLPIRMEVYYFGGTYLFQRLRITKFIEPVQGVTIPAEGTQELWGLADLGMGKPQPILKQGIKFDDFFLMSYEDQASAVVDWSNRNIGYEKYRWILSETTVNQGIPIQTFRMQFPEGFKIKDFSVKR